jgi:hypothetical protein
MSEFNWYCCWLTQASKAMKLPSNLTSNHRTWARSMWHLIMVTKKTVRDSTKRDNKNTGSP